MTTLEPVDLDGDDEAPDPNFEALQAAFIGEATASLEQLLRRPDWHQHAACRGAGPELFYVPRGGNTAPARELCADCSVVAECAEAGTGERFGIWGGAGTVQRRRRPSARGAQLDGTTPDRPVSTPVDTSGLDRARHRPPRQARSLS